MEIGPLIAKSPIKVPRRSDVKNISLSDFDTIVQVAADTGYIKQEDVKRLLAFRNDPQDESWIRG